MTYLLTDGLPHSVSVNGVPFEVETDFRLFVAFERDAFLERWHEREAYDTLRKFYQGAIPDDVNGALEAFLDFYRRGRFEAVDARGKPNYPTGGRSANAYAFDTDDRRDLRRLSPAVRNRPDRRKAALVHIPVLAGEPI